MKVLTYTKQAIRALKKMPKPFSDRFRVAFIAIANDDAPKNLDIKKLTNREGYRLRISDYRAIYTNEPEEIKVLDVGPRGDIY